VLDASDERSVIRGVPNLSPEFYYGDDVGYRYVWYEGEYYLLGSGGVGTGPLGVV
jgi:hypothetical protein